VSIRLKKGGHNIRLRAVSYFSFETRYLSSFFAIHLHNFTFPLSTRGSEESRTTARGLKQCNTVAFCVFQANKSHNGKKEPIMALEPND